MTIRTIPSKQLPGLRAKIMISGPSGARKTRTALQLPGKKLVVDGEKGTIAYKDEFDWEVPTGADGKPWNSDSPYDLEALIDSLLRDPSGFTVFIIDPITTFLHRIRDMADEALRPRAQQKQGARLTQFDSAMNIGAHGRISSFFRSRIYSKLRRLDMAVVVTFREQDMLETTGETVRKVGVKPAGPADSDYEFDTVLHLKKAGTESACEVVKIRGHAVTMEINPWPGGSWLVQRFGEDAFTRPSESRALLTEEQEDEITELVRLLGTSPLGLQKSLARYGVTTVDQLSPDQAEEALAGLRAAWQKKVAPPPPAAGTPAAGAPAATPAAGAPNSATLGATADAMFAMVAGTAPANQPAT